MSETTSKKIIRAGLVVMFFHILWKLSGLVAAVVMSNFGRGDLTDAYFTVFDSVVFAIFLIGEDIFGPAFLPVFLQAKDKKGERYAWKFASSIITWLALILVGVTILSMVFAPEVIGFVAPDFNSTAAGYGVKMVRLMMPAVIPLTIASVTYVLLNGYRIFSYPAAADGINRILFAIVAYIGYLMISMKYLGLEDAWIMLGSGVLLGAFGKIAVHLFALGKDRITLYRPSITTRMPEFKIFLWLALPLIIGILVSRYRDIFENQICSGEEGLVSSLKYSKKLFQAPILIVPYALGIAMFPYLCSLAEKKSFKEYGRIVFYAIHIMVLFLLPITALVLVLRTPIIQSVYQRLGSWGEYDVWVTATLLGFYILGFTFYALETIIMQSFFAMKNTKTPVILGVLASSLHIAFLYIGIKFTDMSFLVILGIAYPASRIFKNTILIILFKKKVPLIAEDRDPLFILKVLIITAGTGVAAYFTYQFIDPMIKIPESGSKMIFEGTKAIRLMICVVAGTSAAVILTLMLKVKEFKMVVDFVKNKGWKKKKKS